MLRSKKFSQVYTDIVTYYDETYFQEMYTVRSANSARVPPGTWKLGSKPIRSKNCQQTFGDL